MIEIFRHIFLILYDRANLSAGMLNPDWKTSLQGFVICTAITLFFVGKIKFRLKEVGLREVGDLAEMDVSKYLKPPLKIPGVGEKSV